MNRMLRQLCSRRRAGEVAPVATHVLVHACGQVLSGAGGEPLVFASAASASSFARRFLCEAAAYRVRGEAVGAAA